MSVDRPNLLTSRTVTAFQRLSTRLRFLLALPVAAALLYLVDHGPLWPGAVVIAFGEFVQLWAAAHLHKDVKMVRSGPYALLRNPMYFGRGFVGLGFTLLTWRWYLIAAYVLAFAGYAQARVLGEEVRLRRLFGEDYEQYCAAVNRWFPRPRTRLSNARWSWEAVGRNHQLRVTLGLAAMLALLWWRVSSPATFGLGR
jgi:hypothetical protein